MPITTRPETPMSYGERFTWGYLTTAVAVPVVYCTIMLGRLPSSSAADISFQRPLIIALAASIALNMFIAPGPRTGRDRRDERDTAINRRGDQAGFYALAVTALVPFVLAMAEVEYFWIANSMYLAFVASAIASSVVKLVAYRRGC